MYLPYFTPPAPHTCTTYASTAETVPCFGACGDADDAGCAGNDTSGDRALMHVCYSSQPRILQVRTGGKAWRIGGFDAGKMGVAEEFEVLVFGLMGRRLWFGTC